MPYADYIYYRDVYHGSLPEEEFTRLSRRASAYLDQLTFGRIKETSEAVMDACCAVVEAMYQEDNPKVASETVGSWSRTYEPIQTTPQIRAYQAAALYLGMTGLMYRGV